MLKAKINEAVGLPAGKQKLQYEVISPSYITYTSILLLPLLITSYYFLGPFASKQKLL